MTVGVPFNGISLYLRVANSLKPSANTKDKNKANLMETATENSSGCFPSNKSKEV